MAGHLHVRAAGPAAAAYHLIVVTRATDVPAILAKLPATDTTLIPVLATSVPAATFDQIKDYQVIDFRKRRRATLEAFAHLIGTPTSRMFYGTRVTPKNLRGLTLPSPAYYAELISHFFTRRFGISADRQIIIAPLLLAVLVFLAAVILDRPPASPPAATPTSTFATNAVIGTPTQRVITMVPITAGELSLSLGTGWVFSSAVEPSPITQAFTAEAHPVLLARHGSMALFGSGIDDTAAMTVVVLQYQGAQPVDDYLSGKDALAHDGEIVTDDARLNVRLFTLSKLQDGLVGWLYSVSTPTSSVYLVYVPALPLRFTASVPPPDEVSAVIAGVGLAQP
jgi:hypothetical protein